MKEITDSEAVYRIIFDHMEIPLLADESAELEFRKTVYKHKFDR